MLFQNPFQKQPNQPSKEPFPLELERYPAAALLAAWKNADRTNATVELNANDPFFSIELDGFQQMDEGCLRAFLAQLPQYDKMVQQFCRKTYEASQFGAKNYVVSLAWISIETSRKIVLGYWGVFVNVELRAILEADGPRWKITALYYQ